MCCCCCFSFLLSCRTFVLASYLGVGFLLAECHLPNLRDISLIAMKLCYTHCILTPRSEISRRWHVKGFKLNDMIIGRDVFL